MSFTDIKDQASALDFLNQLTLGHFAVVTKISEEQLGTHPLKESAVSVPSLPGYYFFPVIKSAILKCFQYLPMSNQADMGWDKFPLVPLPDKGGPAFRRVPGAIVRLGAYVSPKAILMPSFVNLGGWVGEGSMIDTWATVGSCAYVGNNVHCSGGVGLGGVLEPAQANPVVIADDVFLGSRAIIVEGAVIADQAVIGAGVVITSSTKIYDRRKNATQEFYQGYVPPRSVVIPGSKDRGDGFNAPCALIIGERKESTDRKTSLNSALRDFGVSG